MESIANRFINLEVVMDKRRLFKKKTFDPINFPASSYAAAATKFLAQRNLLFFDATNPEFAEKHLPENDMLEDIWAYLPEEAKKELRIKGNSKHAESLLRVCHCL